MRKKKNQLNILHKITDIELEHLLTLTERLLTLTERMLTLTVHPLTERLLTARPLTERLDCLLIDCLLRECLLKATSTISRHRTKSRTCFMSGENETR
jgi:hypothetical protein